MSEGQDLFRFLTRKKKKDQNKKNAPNTITTESKEKSIESSNGFVLPSFSSSNSIQLPYKNEYNPNKYFSQSIEDYLNLKMQKQFDFKRKSSREKMVKQPIEVKQRKKSEEVEEIRILEEMEIEETDENVNVVQELRECEVCGRKFNIKSYEKHIRVCEKVFFQKRKPFKSRSVSKEKK